jgi:anti-anti-sigma factor
MQEPPLRIEPSHEDGSVVLRLHGELDMATAPQVDAAVRDALAQGDVVVDLSALDFLDSTGLRTMIVAREEAARAGRRLALVPGIDNVQRVFKLTGLLDRFEWLGSPEPSDER